MAESGAPGAEEDPRAEVVDGGVRRPRGRGGPQGGGRGWRSPAPPGQRRTPGRRSWMAESGAPGAEEDPRAEVVDGGVRRPRGRGGPQGGGRGWRSPAPPGQRRTPGRRSWMAESGAPGAEEDPRAEVVDGGVRRPRGRGGPQGGGRGWRSPAPPGQRRTPGRRSWMAESGAPGAEEDPRAEVVDGGVRRPRGRGGPQGGGRGWRSPAPPGQRRTPGRRSWMAESGAPGAEEDPRAEVVDGGVRRPRGAAALQGCRRSEGLQHLSQASSVPGAQSKCPGAGSP
nr:collagen alpha-1(I) chain-like [Pelodiscus sinensis]|eukprot:XP_025045420.1 collagen alpha-1(I) chain-like [Pelodiscus sinensis]